MEISKAILDELHMIAENMDRIEKRVIAIDSSITGDEERGVVGMKQHIKTLQKDLEAHTANDEAEFSKIKELINRTGGIVVGAVAVISAVWAFITVIAKA